jgi:hypothetical protein
MTGEIGFQRFALHRHWDRFEKQFQS